MRFVDQSQVHATLVVDVGHAQRTARTVVAGAGEVYNFVLKARRNAATPWDKLEVTVRVKDLLPVRQVFYDEEGKKMRVLSFSDFRSVGGRTRPGKMTMKPLDKPGELTEMLFSKVDFDVKLTKGFFSLQKLKAL